MYLFRPVLFTDLSYIWKLSNKKRMVVDFGGFFSTHVLEVAEKLCNRIAVISGGKLIVEGDTKELTRDKSLEDVFMEVTHHDKAD